MISKQISLISSFIKNRNFENCEAKSVILIDWVHIYATDQALTFSQSNSLLKIMLKKPVISIIHAFRSELMLKMHHSALHLVRQPWPSLRAAVTKLFTEVLRTMLQNIKTNNETL